MPTELPNERAFLPPGSMELDPSGDGVATDETLRLISSRKVEGTAVYDRAGDELGTVDCFMVDKVTGQVAYVVLSFGGLDPYNNPWGGADPAPQGLLLFDITAMKWTSAYDANAAAYKTPQVFEQWYSNG